MRRRIPPAARRGAGEKERSDRVERPFRADAPAHRRDPSDLASLEDAPRQGAEGAPDAWLELEPWAADALDGLAAGDELLVLTWLHAARRDVLRTHPRNDPSLPLAGVFATRSPHRPNPIGLHPVTIRAIEGRRLRIGPIEAVDGTPVIDLKPVL